MSPTSPLPPMSAAERLETDYRHLELSTGPHAMALVRPQLQDVWRAGDLSQARDGDLVRVAGAVICRQRPGTAKGILFLSLEDESGIANAIVAPELFERLRLLIVHEPFLVVEGVVQKRHGVIHLRAHSIAALRHGALAAGPSHDFH